MNDNCSHPDVCVYNTNTRNQRNVPLAKVKLLASEKSSLETFQVQVGRYTKIVLLLIIVVYKIFQSYYLKHLWQKLLLIVPPAEDTYIVEHLNMHYYHL